MKHILEFDIKDNGLFSSFPYFGKYFMALAASFFADYLRQSGKMSTTVTRKVFTTFAVATPGCMMILQVFFGHSQTWSVVIFTIALTLNGAVTAGYLGNGLDIAPNFSGTIFGMANTLSSFGGYLSTWMVGVLTFENVSTISAPCVQIIIEQNLISVIFSCRTLMHNGKLCLVFWQQHTFLEVWLS